MNRLHIFAIAALLVFCTAQLAYARGMGGAHGGGGRSPGGLSQGNRGGGGQAGGNRSRGAGAGGNRSTGTRPGGAQGSGARPGGFSAARQPGGSPQSLQAHQQFPTDAGQGAAGGGDANHRTQPINSKDQAAQGAAVRNNYNGAGTFNNRWYGAHADAWKPAGWTGGYAWHTGSWATVAPVMGYSAAAQPIAYNYGQNVSYQGDQVYSETQPTTTADDYYQQASTLAQAAPPASPPSNDWTPLGVFALVKSAEATPRYVMQLAVNPSGELAGNYCDLVSDTIKPVKGTVDKKTQRVAWTVGNNTTTVGEAGLYNLTQDEAPALIHIGPGQTQQWLLVRLKQSEEPPN